MKKGKVLALDYGKKRVGVATGDLEMRVAFPRLVLPNNGKQNLIKSINDLVEELDVKSIVIGLPLNMDLVDEGNEMIDEVRYFVSQLRKSFPKLEITLYDERLSSFEASQLKREAIMSNVKNPHGKDAYAAQVILQRFFDNLEN